MIHTYSDFLTQELLLESEIKYSDTFRNILSSINHPVAQSLISIENQDITTNINFISPLEDDQVSFMQDKKASPLYDQLKNNIVIKWNEPNGILKNDPKNQNIFDLLGFVPPQTGSLERPSSTDTLEVVKEVISPKSGNVYVLIKFGDKQTVINKERLIFTNKSNEIWTQPGRQPMKIGRVVNQLLQNTQYKHSAPEIAEFVTLYRTANDDLKNIQVVMGDEIAFWYNKRNYEPAVGRSELHQSCMSSIGEDTFQIYTKNPDKCKMIIQKSESDPSKITARALLWTLKSGEQFMDRVYFNHPDSLEIFRKYCKKNNFYCKYANTNGDSPYVLDPSDDQKKNLSTNMVIELKKFPYSHFPYMDTFKYYNPNKSILNIHGDGDSDFYKLEDTGGDYIRQDGSDSCDRCDGTGYIECWECNGRGSVFCHNCHSKGVVTDDDGNEIECPECDGKKKINCEDCDGVGETPCPECSW